MLCVIPNSVEGAHHWIYYKSREELVEHLKKILQVPENLDASYEVIYGRRLSFTPLPNPYLVDGEEMLSLLPSPSEVPRSSTFRFNPEAQDATYAVMTYAYDPENPILAVASKEPVFEEFEEEGDEEYPLEPEEPTHEGDAEDDEENEDSDPLLSTLRMSAEDIQDAVDESETGVEDDDEET